MYNFRATLIVTPTSVLSQWVGQIEEHVSKNVDIEIFVHHDPLYLTKRFYI